MGSGFSQAHFKRRWNGITSCNTIKKLEIDSGWNSHKKERDALSGIKIVSFGRGLKLFSPPSLQIPILKQHIARKTDTRMIFSSNKDNCFWQRLLVMIMKHCINLYTVKYAQYPKQYHKAWAIWGWTPYVVPKLFFFFNSKCMTSTPSYLYRSTPAPTCGV